MVTSLLDAARLQTIVCTSQMDAAARFRDPDGNLLSAVQYA